MQQPSQLSCLPPFPFSSKHSNLHVCSRHSPTLNLRWLPSGCSSGFQTFFCSLQAFLSYKAHVTPQSIQQIQVELLWLRQGSGVLESQPLGPPVAPRALRSTVCKSVVCLIKLSVTFRTHPQAGSFLRPRLPSHPSHGLPRHPGKDRRVITSKSLSFSEVVCGIPFSPPPAQIPDILQSLASGDTSSDPFPDLSQRVTPSSELL